MPPAPGPGTTGAAGAGAAPLPGPGVTPPSECGAAPLAVQAARGGISRPTVEVTATGLRLARWLGHEFAPWEQVGPVKSGESRRLVPTQWLEIDLHVDGEERLVTLPGWRLGVPVEQVAVTIEAARPPSGDD